MNTQLMQLNDITIALSWTDEENKVYVTYHKNFNQIMDSNVFSTLEKKQIAFLVDSYCQMYSLNIASY